MATLTPPFTYETGVKNLSWVTVLREFGGKTQWTPAADAEVLELAQAELCRQGLLIEIEGWADLG